MSGSFAAASSCSSASLSSTSPTARRQSKDAIASRVSRPLETGAARRDDVDPDDSSSRSTRAGAARVSPSSSRRGRTCMQKRAGPGRGRAPRRDGGSPESTMPASARIGAMVRDGGRAPAADRSRGESEHLVGAVAQQRCGQRERRVVRRLEPELEHDAGRPRRGALVESEAEVPGSARPPREARVDPRAESPFERGIPCVRGSSGGGRRARRRSARRRPARRPSRPRARAARCAARSGELVDGAAVEVVDEGVDVAVERVRRRGRSRMCDRRRARRGRGRRSSRPTARASDRRPPRDADGRALPRRSGARRRGRRRRRALPPREAVGRGRRESDQLVELEQPRGYAAPGEVEVGDGRQPEVEVACGERPVRVADERERARIVLPEQLERRRRRRGRVGGVVGHEPSRIGARAAVAAGAARRERRAGRS